MNELVPKYIEIVSIIFHQCCLKVRVMQMLWRWMRGDRSVGNAPIASSDPAFTESRRSLLDWWCQSISCLVASTEMAQTVQNIFSAPPPATIFPAKHRHNPLNKYISHCRLSTQSCKAANTILLMLLPPINMGETRLSYHGYASHTIICRHRVGKKSLKFKSRRWWRCCVGSKRSGQMLSVRHIITIKGRLRGDMCLAGFLPWAGSLRQSSNVASGLLWVLEKPFTRIWAGGLELQTESDWRIRIFNIWSSRKVWWVR